MRCQTGSFRLLGWALLFLLMSPCFGLSASGLEAAKGPGGGNGVCPLDSGQKATVLSLNIVGTDLVFQLATTPDLGDDFTVSLRQPAGEALALQASVVPAAPSPLVTLPGVMQGAERRDIRYSIEVTDSAGVEAMRPFPFSILFDCPKGQSCTYYPLAGVSTSGLLVTEDLYALISESTDCDLLALLETLRGGKGNAALAPDISTLIAQLRRLGVMAGMQKECSFAWLTVVPIDQGFWIKEASSSSPNPGQEVWEFAGGRAGATLCYTGQARSLSESFGVLYTRTRVGRSALSNVIRCVQAGVSCSEPCVGTVTTDFAYNSCAIAEAQGLTEGGRAKAETSMSLSLEVNQTSQLGLLQTVEASATFPEAVDDVEVVKSALPTAVFSAPMNARIDSAGSFMAATELPNGIAPPAPSPLVPPLPTFVGLVKPEPPLSGETSAYAYTEGYDSFTFETLASSMCTLRPSVYSIIQTPAPDVAQKSGGIKIKRWADPP